MKCEIQHVDIDKVKIKRAGIVLFTKYKKSIWFGMGIDRNSGDISDFGGHRIHNDSDIIETAIREFDEETLGVCGKIKKENIKNCYCIFDRHTMIIFYPTQIDIKNSIINFKNTVYDKTEMSGLIWIKYDKMKSILDNPETSTHKMYSRIRKIFCKEEIINDIKI